jgi:hypothetical protein
MVQSYALLPLVATATYNNFHNLNPEYIALFIAGTCVCYRRFVVVLDFRKIKHTSFHCFIPLYCVQVVGAALGRLWVATNLKWDQVSVLASRYMIVKW